MEVDLMVPEVIQLTKVGVCGCGQQVAPGERAGYSPALDQVVCLSCLKALQGEPRRRFRVPRETFEVSAPTVAGPTAEATAPNLPPLAARLFEPPAPTTAADSAAVPTVPTDVPGAPAATRASRQGQTGQPHNPIWDSLLRAAQVVSRNRPPGQRTHGPVDPMLDAASDVLVLHHRPLPGRRATIAHLVVGPAGVYVVEVQDGAPLSVAVRRAAKHEPGSSQDDDLLVGGHPHNHLLTAFDARVEFVKQTLSDHGLEEVPVVRVLCFLRGMPALVDRRLKARETHIVAPKGLGRLVATPGDLGAEDRLTLFGLFEATLPSLESVESS
jgi:hypothetical protein